MMYAYIQEQYQLNNINACFSLEYKLFSQLPIHSTWSYKCGVVFSLSSYGRTEYPHTVVITLNVIPSFLKNPQQFPDVPSSFQCYSKLDPM